MAARHRTLPLLLAGWASPACVAPRRLKIDAESKVVRIAGTDVELREGDVISIDGTTGTVVLGSVALVAAGGDRRLRHHPEVGR